MYFYLTARLVLCLDTIRDIVGDTVPDSVIKKHVIENDFNCEQALDAVLNKGSVAYVYVIIRS